MSQPLHPSIEAGERAMKPTDVCGQMCDAGFRLMIGADGDGRYVGEAFTTSPYILAAKAKGITTWDVVKSLWEHTIGAKGGGK